MHAAHQGLKLALLRDGLPVVDFEAAGAPFVDQKRGQIQFTGAIGLAR